MSKTIYNEGRVVGLSAYELFIRNHPDPENAPSEKEWLASTVGYGESLILRLPDIPDQSMISGDHIYDIPLPENSGLRASNCIIGSYFIGECKYTTLDSDGAGWADEITSYGTLISNTDSISPDGDIDTDDVSSGVLPYTDIKLSDTEVDRMKNYMKLVDAIVIQPGHWQEPQDTRSYTSDLVPDLSQVPVLRLHIKGPMNTHPQILLTGFSDAGVLAAVSGLDGSSTSDHPENGDFIGPQIFPWCTKVFLTVPTAYATYGDKELLEGWAMYRNQIQGDEYPSIISFQPDKDGYPLYATSLSRKRSDTSTSPIYEFDVEESSKASADDTLYLNKYGHITWSQLFEAYANNRPIDPLKIKDLEGNVSDMIKPDRGISVTKDNTSGAYTIANIMQISSGFGILVEESSPGNYSIINTMPNVDTTNFKYLRLGPTDSSSGHYTLQTYGTSQFADPQASRNIINYMNDPTHNPNGERYNTSGQFGVAYDGNYYPNIQSAGSPDISLHDGGGVTQQSKFDITVRIGVDDKADGTIRRVYLEISGTKNYYDDQNRLVRQSTLYADNLSSYVSNIGYRNGCCISHDASLNSAESLKVYRMVASSIIGIYFNDLDENIRTLSNRDISFSDVYDFMNTHTYYSKTISNVWNMKLSDKIGRTSWPVNCGSYYGQNPKHPPYVTHEELEDRQGIIIYAFQIYDGFNSYFSNLHSYEGSGNDSELDGIGLNLQASGYFQ